MSVMLIIIMIINEIHIISSPIIIVSVKNITRYSGFFLFWMSVDCQQRFNYHFDYIMKTYLMDFLVYL